MRILVICQHYWPENFRITDICEGLVHSGNSVDVLCGLPNYPSGEYTQGYSYTKPRRQTQNGVNIYRSGEIRRKGNTNLRIFLNYISYPISACFNLYKLIGNKYDAVFCYQLSPVLMLAPAIIYAKTHSLPLTCYVLDLWPENLYSVLPIQNKMLRGIASGISHWMYRRCNKIIAMSQSMKQKFNDITPKLDVDIIPQYCEDFYAKTAVPQHISGIQEKFVVMFTGNFSPAQDLDLLITCAQKMKKSDINNIVFVLVGDGMSKEKLVNDIDNAKVKDYFVLLPRCAAEQIPAICASAHALFAALASSDDLGLTVPAKIASYMACAKPLLVAMSGEGNKAVMQAQCGLVSESGDADALYENIIKLSRMPKEEIAQMSSNAKAFYIANYSRKQNLEKLENAIIYKAKMRK